MLTYDTIEVESQPYTVTELGYTLCGACLFPTRESKEVPLEPRGRFVPVNDNWDDDQWSYPTPEEFLAELERDIGRCDGCKLHPAEFPVFVQTAQVVVEHFRCRIY